MIASNFSAGNSTKGARCWIPALFTRTSIAPNCSSIRFTSRMTASRSVTSAIDVDAATPSSFRCRAAAPVRSWLRPLRTTLAPARGSPAASEYPMPRLEPVTKATFPFSEKRASRLLIWVPSRPRFDPSKLEMNLDRAALVRREIEGRRRFGGGHGGGQERSDLRAVAGDIIDRQVKFLIEAEATDHIDLLGHDRRHVDLRPRAFTPAYT